MCGNYIQNSCQMEYSRFLVSFAQAYTVIQWHYAQTKNNCWLTEEASGTQRNSVEGADKDVERLLLKFFNYEILLSIRVYIMYFFIGTNHVRQNFSRLP